MGELLASGTAVLHQTVLDELRRHRDPLVEWVEGQDGVEVMPTSEDALEKYLDVCAWAESQSYTSRGRYANSSLRPMPTSGFALRRWPRA